MSAGLEFGMVVTLQVVKDESDSACSIEYRVAPNADAIQRRVALPSGFKVTTEVTPGIEGPESEIELHAAFDRAWLRSSQWPPNTHEPTLRVVDLFSSIGAMTLGTWEASRAIGYRAEPVLAVDVDEAALGVYGMNFPTARIECSPAEQLFPGEVGAELSDAERNLRESLGEVDILIAGPPCQGHSDLNNHTRRNDTRNALMSRVARAAEVLRPRHIVIENVPPAIHDRTQVVQSTAASLRDMGYFVDWGVLHARSLGVAQRRRRFFLLASKVAQPNLSEILSCSEVPDRSLEWACADLMDIDHPRGVFDSSAVHSAENRRRIDFLFDNDLHDLPNAERPDCHRLKPHSYTSVYGRMYWDRPAPTITSGFGSTGQGRFVHPHRRRTLTPHEAARVQFIPDFFKFGELGRVKLQKMIGNAVPPKLSYAVTLHLLMNEMEAACRP